MPEPTDEALDAFIAKWSSSGGHERGAGQQFLLELCDLLCLAKPDPPQPEHALNAYTFERRVDRHKPDGSVVPNWIDLYKAGHFVLETKQGVNPRRDKSSPDQPLLPELESAPAPATGHGQRGTAAFDKALLRAHSQAERYIHALPVEDGRPPFLIVCDVGHSFDLYAEFSGTGGQYECFPDPRSHRVTLERLREPEVRDLFRAIWTDPHSLDPAKRAAAVTREVAKALADLARSLEADGHDPVATAGFLQRCLFTMFAEDVGLLPKDSFLELLRIAHESPAGFPVLLQGLWKDMATGATFSATIRAAIPHFNGGLFADTSALKLRPDQIAYLLHAAKQDWSAVEPAIFGTLLERALDPRERHKLGAHYTPRSYVERLVRPTIIEPLRDQWDAVRTAAAQLDEQGKSKQARAAVEKFHHELAAIRVLDPACGSGNFLYVSLELLKRLEAEVLDLFESLGGDRRLEMDTVLIRPANFLGIEINPRAAAIAQLVLWIGYFQWHKRTTGHADTNDRPLLPKKNTIECRDAVLEYDERIPRRNPDTGEVETIWDGRTTKPHPVTGKEVPDESARTTLFDYPNPRRPQWPQADFIVGNPPFIGKHRMRDALGDGYVEALRKAWKKYSPDAWDFVMFWWYQAAEILQSDMARRFGLITTNSIHQTFNRRVLDAFLSDRKHPLHLVYAVPDHPWVDSVDGADVRIAITVVGRGSSSGAIERVVKEISRAEGEREVLFVRNTGIITPGLRLGADLNAAGPLHSNENISNHGIIRGGVGFLVHPADLESLGYASRSQIRSHLRPICNGSDLTGEHRRQFVIDLYGLTESDVRERFPEIYQWVYTRVRPGRLKNKRATRRENWWLFNESVPKLRKMLAGLERFISTSETAKHRVFVFMDRAVLPEHKLVNIAHSDSAMLGILSSTVHVCWALAAGGRLGVGNDPVYVKSLCFECFPFPALEDGALKERIREFGKRLDAHRKERQAAHPALTLTGMYNVLEKLRRGEALSDKERVTHDEGLVTILKQIHDDLDAAVLEAYGWEDLAAETPLADRLAAGDEEAEALEQDLLTRLVALNHERAEEEKRGLIRWLRSEYQAPDAEEVPPAEQKQIALEAEQASAAAVPVPDKLPWPKTLPERVAAIQKLLPALGPDPDALAARFGRRTKARLAQIGEILDTLRSLGKL